MRNLQLIHEREALNSGFFIKILFTCMAYQTIISNEGALIRGAYRDSQPIPSNHPLIAFEHLSLYTKAMSNNGQQWATMDNNGKQWTTMDSNGQRWTKMDNNGATFTATCTSDAVFSTVGALSISMFRGPSIHPTHLLIASPPLKIPPAPLEVPCRRASRSI